MNLKPVEIFFSQDSISNTFDRRSQHRSTYIGETLDQICEGRCSIDNIPTISVAKIDGRLVTADNRRLWVFRQLYRLNKCDTVPVHVTDSIPPKKMTSDNKGVSIMVRRDPGGQWHQQPSVRSEKPTLPVARPFIVEWGSTNTATNLRPLTRSATKGSPTSPHTCLPTLHTSRSVSRFTTHSDDDDDDDNDGGYNYEDFGNNCDDDSNMYYGYKNSFDDEYYDYDDYDNYANEESYSYDNFYDDDY